MERRWTTRTRLNLDVDVSREGSVPTGCKTKDIGLGGVFVNVGARILEKGDQVELIFKVLASSEVEEHKIRAKVVRVDDDGAGLMFRDFDANAFRSLQRVMRAKDGLTVR